MSSSKPLSEQVKLGLDYFQWYPDRIGTKQWRLFVRTVLKPNHDNLMETIDEDQKKAANKLLALFGGYLIGAEANQQNEKER